MAASTVRPKRAPATKAAVDKSRKLPTSTDGASAQIAGTEQLVRTATAFNGNRCVPAPVNEPIKSYAPGSAERAALKERLGTIAYVGAAVRETRKRKMFEANVTVDGDVFYKGPASCVLVGNTGSLKGGIDAFPDANSTDGRLHVAVVSATGMREWASLMVRAAMRKQQWPGHSEIAEGTEITVKFDKKQRFELDGGVKGKAKKLDFEIRPRSLVICAPA